MKSIPLPPLQEIQKRLALSASSPSGLIWIEKGTRGIKPGDVAGKRNINGYWQVRFKKKSYYAHRLIYYIKTGVDPLSKEVDHIEGLSQPLKVRLATSQENNYNLKKRVNSKSKYKGVRAKREKWQAGIHADGRYKNLGVYKDEISAAKAYNKAALELFGEFARINKLEKI
jgi:hypothetical protein